MFGFDLVFFVINFSLNVKIGVFSVKILLKGLNCGLLDQIFRFNVKISVSMSKLGFYRSKFGFIMLKVSLKGQNLSL